jgi:hypothetical protein
MQVNIVFVHPVPSGNIDSGETDYLAVFNNRRILGDRAYRHLVAAWNALPSGRTAGIRTDDNGVDRQENVVLLMEPYETRAAAHFRFSRFRSRLTPLP